MPGSRAASGRVWRMLVGIVGGAALLLAAVGPVVAAGESTSGVTVKAVNPATSRLGSDVELSLTAHTEASSVADPSCRPQDANIECWGSLLLRLPKFGDLAVGNFQVHRVAVGDISCGGDDGDDGCGDHEVAFVAAASDPVKVQINGVAYVKWPGNTGLAVGTKLQIKLTLTDNGSAAYADQVVVQVNLFVEGPNKPLLYRSAPETIKQVQIHFTDAG